MELNPYAAPRTQNLLPPAPSQVEATRAAHIETEATIKAVAGLILLFAALMLLVGSLSFNEKPGCATSPFMTGPVLVVLSLVLGAVGVGMRRLRSWARIPGALVSSIGLLGFPIGTLISGYALVKLLGRQGRLVMSEEYREIIVATPHVKRKTSVVLKVLLFVLLAIIAIGIIAAITIPSK
jgi:hypothetical protein